ncbi:MAG: hypothetical protein ACFFG0_37415, partial [Candidatus Thorarchaeota archaeon]
MKRKESIKLGMMFLLLFLCIMPIFLGFSKTNPYVLDRLQISADPNVELISESSFTTRWDFVNETAGCTTLYYEPFDNASSYWDLYNVDERIMYLIYQDIADAFTTSDQPNENWGDVNNFQVKNNSAEIRSFIKKELTSYLLDNYTQNSTFRAYAFQTAGFDTGYIDVYSTSDFGELTITWNNQPEPIDFISQIYISSSNNWYTFDFGNPNIFYYTLLANSVETVYVPFWGKTKTTYKPSITHYISKNFQGDGFLYCQTNTTETITLRSDDNLDKNLVIGDKIEVKFNTSSVNRIDFNLRNNGVQQKSYILSSQGNGDFSNRIKTFTIDANMSIDQMEFTGTFEDTKNLQIDYVKIYRGYQETDSYYLAPYERRDLDLGYSYNYTVEIYENDVLMETKYLTTSATLQTLIYERIESEIVYLVYYDSNNEYLDFNLFTTYINYTLDNFTYTNERLSSHILYVDENSLIKFKIYDSFNVLVKSYQTYEQTFIDTTLDIYNLKIKNEASKFVNYTLTKSGSEIEKSGNIYPEEVIEFNIASGSYTLN